MTLDLLANLADQLAEHLPRRQRSRSGAEQPRSVRGRRPQSAVARLALRARSARRLPSLLQIFATSQHLSDLLIQDTESYDLLRMTEGQPVGREPLVAEVCAEVAALADDPAAVAKALRRFKRRETLRISYGDIIRGQSVDTVTRQISYLADAMVEAAVLAARRKVADRRGAPTTPIGQAGPVRRPGVGKAGGRGTELFQRHRPDLSLRRTDAGPACAAQQHAGEFFDRVAREVLRLLTEPTEFGTVYRVDLRLRPDGQNGPIVTSLESAMHYYDVSGRTWERQAFVKARPVAGDLRPGPRIPRPARALDLSPLSQPGRHHGHQGPQAPHRAAQPRAKGPTAATSKPATAASATSNSSSSSCNCSTAATCPPCAPATRSRRSPSWKTAAA